MNSFSKNSLISFITDVLVFVLGFPISIIIARTLGPMGKGVYSLILLIPSIIIVFANFGIGSANVYFVGSKRYKIQDIVSNSLILSFFLGSISVLMFWGLVQFDFFQKFITTNQIPLFYLWMIIFTIPISLLLDYFRNIIRGKGEIINYNKTRILEAFVQLVAVVIFLLLFKKGVFGAVLSYNFAIIAAILFTIIFIKKITGLHLSLNKNLLKDSAIYGGKVNLANALSYLNYRSDMFFIAIFLTPAAVGFYSLAVGMCEKLFMIPGAIATVLFPRISSISSSEADDFTPKVARHTLFFLLISSLLLLLLAKPLITIFFGSIFLPSVKPLILLLPGIIAFGIGGLLAADLSGRGKPEFAVFSSFACFIVDIILNFILIPRFGVSGASIASSIAYSIDTLVILIAFLKISKKPLTEILFIQKSDFKDYLQVFSDFKDWIKGKN